jgi:hypothetical protein
MTLDSHEIRLGNTYKVEMGDGTYKSDLINLEDLRNLLDDEIDDFYQAMEISEEWLIRFGFKCVLDMSYSFPKPYNNLELAYCGSINGFKKGWVITKLFGFSNGIKYVHELENLYFALTGEELTYKC